MGSTGCVGAIFFDRKGASDYAISVLTVFIKSLGFNGILVSSDNDRSLLSLMERVTRKLTGVELVMMFSPKGDYQANGFAVVGVREIEAQTRILRSLLEQEVGSRIYEKDRSGNVVDTTSCSELCVQIRHCPCDLMQAVPSVDRRRDVKKRDLVKNGYADEC